MPVVAKTPTCDVRVSPCTPISRSIVSSPERSRPTRTSPIRSRRKSKSSAVGAVTLANWAGSDFGLRNAPAASMYPSGWHVATLYSRCSGSRSVYSVPAASPDMYDPAVRSDHEGSDESEPYVTWITRNRNLRPRSGSSAARSSPRNRSVP
jgi:hypothetical protein